MRTELYYFTLWSLVLHVHRLRLREYTTALRVNSGMWECRCICAHVRENPASARESPPRHWAAGMQAGCSGSGGALHLRGVHRHGADARRDGRRRVQHIARGSDKGQHRRKGQRCKLTLSARGGFRVKTCGVERPGQRECFRRSAGPLPLALSLSHLHVPLQLLSHAVYRIRLDCCGCDPNRCVAQRDAFRAVLKPRLQLQPERRPPHNLPQGLPSWCARKLPIAASFLSAAK